MSQHLWQQQGAGWLRVWLESGVVVLALLAGATPVVALGWRWAVRRMAEQGNTE